jgi:hypothetical protein
MLGFIEQTRLEIFTIFAKAKRMSDAQLSLNPTVPNESRDRDDRAKREALLTINGRRSLVILRSAAEKTCDVLLYDPPSFWVNDMGELQTDYGAINVRVASVFRIDEDEEAEPVYRIVLEEFEELPQKAPPAPKKLKRRTLTSRLRYLPWRRMLAFAVVLVALPLVAFCAYKGRRYLWKTEAVSGLAEAKSAAKSGGTPAVSPVQGISARAPMAHSSGSGASTVRSVTEPIQAALPKPTFEQLHLQGARPFMVPEVARALGLTPQQIAAFKDTNRATELAVRDLNVFWQSDGPEQHARRLGMILDAARQQSLNLLTPDQRHRLAELSK